jgi:betaine-aldehyde dehydrogenase
MVITLPERIDRIFIGGRWVTPSSGDRTVATSPTTERALASVANAAVADVDRAVAEARRAFETSGWATSRAEDRAAALRPLARGLTARARELAELISLEMGCPLDYSLSRQVPGAAMMVDYFADLAASTAWEQRRPGIVGDSLVVREPVGVVAAVVPWNTPFLSIMVKLVPALVAGCAVVVKAPPEIALCASEVASLLEDCDLPAGLVSVLVADREVSEHLVSHPEVDKVAFTGSTEAGKRILEICARSMRRATMELGGKSAAIVLDDADVDSTAAGLVAGGMSINGQMCTAQQRVLVPRNLRKVLRDAVCDRVTALVVGDPLDERTGIGPLVASRQRDRVEALFDTARKEGATTLRGGGRPAGLDRGWFVEPTVFDDVTPAMTIANVEVFGPVLCLMAYDDVDEAVTIANATAYGLAGAVWTGDGDRGIAVARRIRTGTCGVNRYGVDFGAPFGGFKQSGLGRELGPEGLDAFVEYKTIALPIS